MPEVGFELTAPVELAHLSKWSQTLHSAERQLMFISSSEQHFKAILKQSKSEFVTMLWKATLEAELNGKIHDELIFI